MNENKSQDYLPRSAMIAPHITPQQVNELIGRVEYHTSRGPEGTTSTFCHAYLKSVDGKRKFFLVTAHSACVSPENFNEQVGRDIAISKAGQLVKDKLWEVLGFTLFKELDV